MRVVYISSDSESDTERCQKHGRRTLEEGDGQATTTRRGFI